VGRRRLSHALAAPFGQLSALIRLHVEQCPEREALADEQSRCTWRQLGESIDRITLSLHRDAVRKGDLVALLGLNSVRYAAAYLAILSLGAIPAPLSNSSTPAAIGAMLADCGARWLFVDPALQSLVPPDGSAVQQIRLDFRADEKSGDAWLAAAGIGPDPSDLEAALKSHPDVEDAAVVGAPSERWGETPVGFVVLRRSHDPFAILAHANGNLGKTQRLAAIHIVDELPRSAIGKILKRELRERARSAAGSAPR